MKIYLYLFIAAHLHTHIPELAEHLVEVRILKQGFVKPRKEG